MEYTVNQLAKLSGVSGRTLRYYDQIGLLKPSRINASGYRIYGEKEVDLLQQILFFRELEVSLEDIKQILYQPSFDETTALKKHFCNLKQKRNRLDKIIATLEKTLESKEGGLPMNDKDKFEGLKEKLIEENEEKYGKEIREKYGNDVIDNSNAKFRGMSKQDYESMVNLGEEILELLIEAYNTGDPKSDVAQELAENIKNG